jgi:hypothetical protein
LEQNALIPRLGDHFIASEALVHPFPNKGAIRGGPPGDTVHQIRVAINNAAIAVVDNLRLGETQYAVGSLQFDRNAGRVSQSFQRW